MKQEENFDQSRRNFLKITTITAAAAACGSLACSCNSKGTGHEKHGDKVKLLTQDGEIVEIDSSHLHTGTHDHMGMATKEEIIQSSEI